MRYFSTPLLGLLGAVALLSGCGGGGGGSSKPQAPGSPTPTVTVAPVPTATAVPTQTASPTATPLPTVTAPPTPTPTPVPNAERLSNTSCIAPDGVGQPGAVTSVAAFPNLPAIGFPLALVQAPNAAGGFWFVADRDGQIHSFNNQSNANALNPSLDITARVTTEGEFGLTGMALHPNYPDDNRIFLLYNAANSDGRSTIASFTVNTSNRTINAASETVLLTLDQLTPFHNGGDMHFGTDGYLYASFGDTDWGTGQFAQETNNLYGSIIRIDIDNGSPYGIPASNPFSGNNRCGRTNENAQSCPEIFAYGFRNPWRFSIDSQTGDVWVGDVGDAAREEVNRVSAGGNYGWPIMEGNICGPSNPGCDRSGLELPIADYPSSGSSVVGGYVYRGSDSPALVGRYIFSDFYSGQVSALASDAGANTDEEALFVASPNGPAMARGNDGEIYILAINGDSPGQNIYRISGGGGLSYTMPQNLSDTGCFNLATKTSPSGVFDYSNIAPLWSDGAAKLRAFAIPDGTDIQVLTDGDFDFPTDSILIKHFLNGPTYLETRLMVNHSTGWVGYSYEWNDAQTEAVLLSEGKRKNVGPFVHIYPSQAECQACHTDAANNSLGLELAQLNKSSPELSANFIDYLSTAGYLASDHFGAGSPTLYALDDDSASLEQRARSYLHSNCANCHRPGGPVGGMDLRYYTSFANTNACDVDPQRGDLGVNGAKIIAPGNPNASVLLLRMLASETSGNRMPRLGSIVVDTEATQLINDWIGGLSACP